MDPFEELELRANANKRYGNEAVVPWVIIAAVLVGLLTRSVVGAVVAAIVVFVLWLIVVRAFGGRFMSSKLQASKLVRYCLLGGVAGFAGDFAVRMAGISISLFLATAIGVAVGLALYQFSPVGKKH